MAEISSTAKKLIADFAGEVSDAREWPNEENVRRTRAALCEYVSALEQFMQVYAPSSLMSFQAVAKPADKAFTGGGL